MPADAASSLVCPRCGLGVEARDRFCRACGAHLGAAPSGHELRKTVTVVFCDISGSTALGERLDPEALRHVLGRYYARMRAVLEQHGGLVEKFIGDAVVAVFGVPQVHEDDALRAVKAALQMRASLARVNEELERESGVRIAVRIGVNTGEVVAGDLGPGASFASGDAVNVAARLEQAADADEVLIGVLTKRLLGAAVHAEPLEPLGVHGKAEPIEAFRLLGIAADADGVARRPSTAFVGREQELAVLGEAFAEAVTEPGCRLVTVIGEAGIGKTRLLGEFASSLEHEAQVLVGHCLPYGEGITYWPLAEMVRGLSSGVEPKQALMEHLCSEEGHELVCRLVLGAIGAGENPGQVEETQWAVRRLLEALARERPLLVVLEDLHWAEPTFLQLVEYVAGMSTGEPILLLAAARDELLELRPDWALPRPYSRLLSLAALSGEEAGELIDMLADGQRLAGEAKEGLARAAAGNPLFLEQLVAHQAESDVVEGEPPVPATIKALLAARLDHLTVPQRDLLERAAVAGVTFTRGAVAALLPTDQREEVSLNLLDAVRRNLVRPGRAEPGGDESFRFAHLLVREAVYDSMPKELRAQLHERYADWLEQQREEQGRSDEIVGYHLEQAYLLHGELGPTDEHAEALARRAAGRLSRAGLAAQSRGDAQATAKLLGRAVSLLEPSDPERTTIMPELGAALHAVGRLAEAQGVLAEAVAEASACGDVGLEARAVVEQLLLLLMTDPEGRVGEARAESQRLVGVLEGTRDDRALARAWFLVGLADVMAWRYADMERAMSRSFQHALRARDARQQSEATFWLAASIFAGPTPVVDAIARLEEIQARAPARSHAEAAVLYNLGALYAWAGRLDEGRQMVADSRNRFKELGLEVTWAGSSVGVAFVERYAGGDPAVAESALRDGCEALERMGERTFLSTNAAMLAQTLCDLGRYEEAESWTRLSEEAAASDDQASQVLWRSARAKVVAHRGELAEAERLAREAVALAATGDAIPWTGEALLDLSEVLGLAGKDDQARVGLERARALFEQKGVVHMAERTRALLADFSAKERAGRVPA